MSVSVQIRIGDKLEISGEYDHIPSVGHFIVHTEKESSPIYGQVRSVVWMGPGSELNELENNPENNHDVIIFADPVQLVDGRRGIFKILKLV